MPIFANPAGLWVLLGVPAILAIHFLQQRAQVARTSTWFLIEQLAPDSARGRTWDRLRSSRQLWLQLLCVLLAAWVLAEPRWVRAQSAQTVVIVLDASVSMGAFREPAIAAAERELAQADGLAARTTWVVMTTNPRQPALYRGTERAAAEAALQAWEPELGRHDLGPPLRLARNLAGASGRTLLITDAKEKVPPDQRAVGVGQPIENVGFAGATLTKDGDGHVWRALVKNHAATPQQRTWQVEAGGAGTAGQRLELAAGEMKEISARLPAGVERAVVALAADGFQADDRLPLLAPAPKPLRVVVDGKGDQAEFFRRVAESVDGVKVAASGTPDGTAARLRIGEVDAQGLGREIRGGIFWAPADKRAEAALVTEPVTAERDPLVNGLNWQGWFGTGAHGFARQPGDAPLLWQGKWAIVWLRTAAPAPNETGGARKLVLAFDWATSNAARLPATVLLARRFLEAERDGQRASYTANFDCGAVIGLSGVPLDGEFTMTFEPAEMQAAVETQKAANGKTGGAGRVRAIAPGERVELRAPGRPGFFTVRRGEELLVRGAAQFADARQGDFRGAERFVIQMKSEREAALERNTTGDPFVVFWLVVIGLAAAGSWWTKVSRGGERANGAGQKTRRHGAEATINA